MKQLNPYLNFNGNCREAMTFYHQCLGGDLNIMNVGDSPIAEHMPKDSAGNVMHSSLTNGETTLLASDMCQGGSVPADNRVNVCLNCTSEEETKKLFSLFSEGGEIFCPLEVQFWGSLFGAVTDKFGINWLFNYDKPKE